jgi:hypothetical protein
MTTTVWTGGWKTWLSACEGDGGLVPWLESPCDGEAAGGVAADGAEWCRASPCHDVGLRLGLGSTAMMAHVDVATWLRQLPLAIFHGVAATRYGDAGQRQTWSFLLDEATVTTV